MSKYTKSCYNKTTIDVIERLGGKELLEFHRLNSWDIDASQYLELHEKTLAQGMVRTTVIYLDTNFWIILRNAARRINPVGSKLLLILKKLVRERRVICICQAATFLELAKQSKNSLDMISSLVEELGELIAIVSEDKLRMIESMNYICWKLGAEDKQKHRVWTHLGSILFPNGIVPHLNGFLPQKISGLDSDIVLKCTIDSIWQISMRDILIAFDWKTSDKLSANIDQATIDQIEIRKKKRKEKRLSLEAIRKYEFGTFIPSAYNKAFFQALLSLKRVAKGHIVLQELLNQVNDLIECAVNEALIGELNQYIPGAIISTELYCLYENDIGKKLTSNDWFDMNHARVALPYSDFFFTEKHLKHQICNVLNFDKKYKCKVVSGIDEAIEALNQKFMIESR